MDVGPRVADPSELPEALLAGLPPDVDVTPHSGVVGAVLGRVDTAGTCTWSRTRAPRPNGSRSGSAMGEPWPSAGTRFHRTRPCVARATGANPGLELEAYEAAVLVAYDEEHPPASWLVESGFVSLALDGPWTVVRLPADGPAAPVVLPHRWEDDEALRSYAGTALGKRRITYSLYQSRRRRAIERGYC